jgi:hypothetical protein
MQEEKVEMGQTCIGSVDVDVEYFRKANFVVVTNVANS